MLESRIRRIQNHVRITDKEDYTEQNEKVKVKEKERVYKLIHSKPLSVASSSSSSSVMQTNVRITDKEDYTDGTDGYITFPTLL